METTFLVLCGCISQELLILVDARPICEARRAETVSAVPGHGRPRTLVDPPLPGDRMAPSLGPKRPGRTPEEGVLRPRPTETRRCQIRRNFLALQPLLVGILVALKFPKRRGNSGQGRSWFLIGQRIRNRGGEWASRSEWMLGVIRPRGWPCSRPSSRRDATSPECNSKAGEKIQRKRREPGSPSSTWVASHLKVSLFKYTHISDSFYPLVFRETNLQYTFVKLFFYSESFGVVVISSSLYVFGCVESESEVC